MKVIVESHIPFIRGVFEPYAQVVYADRITPQDVRDADALMVRTRTRCDAALLKDSRVTFIGTATIGTDHIDLDYCRAHDITVASAPGCNAPAVAQWALSTIGHWMQHRGITAMPTLGVVGVGHVGSIVARWAKDLGMKVMLNDPPREAAGKKSTIDGIGYSSLDDIARHCDIITFHTPLSTCGEWPTHHLCDATFLHKAQKCALLINAARGGVCDNQALVAWHGDIALDCWEGEPNIMTELLQKAFVATPHIAGYSIEGKQRGTTMIVEAISKHFSWDIQPAMPEVPALGAVQPTMSRIMRSYNPLEDTHRLKEQPDSFEQLRNNYPLRHEV